MEAHIIDFVMEWSSRFLVILFLWGFSTTLLRLFCWFDVKKAVTDRDRQAARKAFRVTNYVKNLLLGGMVVIMTLFTMTDAVYHPKNTTYNETQRSYEHTRYQERLQHLGENEISLDGVLVPNETSEERGERTKDLLDWRNRE